jgi:hypothetical protein
MEAEVRNAKSKKRGMRGTGEGGRATSSSVAVVLPPVLRRAETITKVLAKPEYREEIDENERKEKPKHPFTFLIPHNRIPKL